MASMLWLCACVPAFIVAWWLFEYGTARRRRMRKLAAAMPGPPAWPLMGNAVLFMAKPGELLTTLMAYLNQYGDCYRLWLGSELLVCVSNAADIRHLLASNKINLKGPLYEFIKRLVGPGVLSEGGPIWRSHRKAAAPAFNQKAVRRYADVVNDSSEDLIRILSSKGPAKTFDVYQDVVQATTDIVCQCIIGLSKEELKDIKYLEVVVKHTHEMYDFIFTNMTRWWFHIPLIYWLSGRRAKEQYYLKITDEMTSDMVSRRRAALRKTIPEYPSLVDRFILSKQMTEQDIKFETMTFFTAVKMGLFMTTIQPKGQREKVVDDEASLPRKYQCILSYMISEIQTQSQEASAKIASMVLLILAHLPEWQDKVFREIVEVVGAVDDVISDEQVKWLKALDMVYKEAIRLMPIGAFIQRTVEDDVTIRNNSITLPKGASVVIPIYAVQRDPRYWENPCRVDPGRFHPKNASKRHPDAYIPYSLGGMDCIGRLFAESLIKILVVRLLRRLQFESDGRIEDLDINVAISVKMAKGYRLRVKPREIVNIK